MRRISMTLAALPFSHIPIVATSGANHNFFNTNWDHDESKCNYGDTSLSRQAQTDIILMHHSSLFRGFVGPQKQHRISEGFCVAISITRAA